MTLQHKTPNIRVYMLLRCTIAYHQHSASCQASHLRQSTTSSSFRVSYVFHGHMTTTMLALHSSYSATSTKLTAPHHMRQSNFFAMVAPSLYISWNVLKTFYVWLSNFPPLSIYMYVFHRRKYFIWYSSHLLIYYMNIYNSPHATIHYTTQVVSYARMS